MKQETEWNYDYEKILKNWKAQAFINMWLHSKSSYYYNTVNNILTYPVIILSAVSGATLFATDFYITRFIIAILSLITVIVACLLLELSPDQKSEQYLDISRKYTTLIRNIDYCLSIPFHMRENPVKFIENINIELENIADIEDIIPKFIINKFEKKYGNLDKILYGDEIIELLTDDIRTTNAAVTIASKFLKNRTLHKKNSGNTDFSISEGDTNIKDL